jgi:hypothetical protein
MLYLSNNKTAYNSYFILRSVHKSIVFLSSGEVIM